MSKNKMIVAMKEFFPKEEIFYEKEKCNMLVDGFTIPFGTRPIFVSREEMENLYPLHHTEEKNELK
jgi:hypothetical protein